LAIGGFDIVLRPDSECVGGASVAIDALHCVQHILRTARFLKSGNVFYRLFGDFSKRIMRKKGLMPGNQDIRESAYWKDRG